MIEFNQMENFLLMLKGSTEITDVPQAQLASKVVKKLKENGHAIVLDETFNHEQKFLTTNVTHYVTCAACKP